MEPKKSARSVAKHNKHSKMEDKQDTIKVVVRVRPAVKGHQNEGSKEYWKPINNTIHFLTESGAVPKTNEYTFDTVYGTDQSNKDVYNSFKPIVKSAVNGINGTVIVYGQTSSGKTHTAMGDSKDKGIIPLAAEDVFRLIKNDTKRKYLLRSSYIEIYNDKINDLLNKAERELKIRENISGAVSIDHCVEQIVRSSDELLDIVMKGNQNRHILNPTMNNRNTRSHVILRLAIESISNDALSDDDDILVQVSYLHFVDLGGSEKSVETNTGARLKDKRNVNSNLSCRSLSIFSRIIHQLVDTESQINFKESALTHLISNSFKGNCRTLIIATVTSTSMDNTESTLMFAQTAKKIKIKPRLNQVLTTESIINQLKHREMKLVNQLKIERTKKLTLNKNQSSKNKVMKDLEQEIKNIQSKYVKRDGKSSNGHGAKNKPGPSSAAPVVPQELQDEAVGPEVMDISEIEPTVNVVQQTDFSDSQMNVEPNKPARKFESKGIQVIDAFPMQMEVGSTKKKEIKRALGDTMAKQEYNNYDMEVSIESIVSLYKMRELEWSYPKDATTKPEPMEFSQSEPLLKKPKNTQKKPCEDVKVSKKFKVREDKLCLEAKLAILKEENKSIMEENADMKFREILWKNKIFGTSRNTNIKSDTRASRSNSISSNKRPAMVRSLSLPNMHDGLLNFNDEIRKEDKVHYLSLQSLNYEDLQKSDDLTKTNATLQTNIVHTGTVRKLKEKNNMLKNHVLALQIQNHKLVRDHRSHLNSMNANHAIQVTSYESMLNEISGYNENLKKCPQEKHLGKLSEYTKKLANANIIINKLKEQLTLMQERLNANEIDMQIELEKLKTHYTGQLASLQLNIVNKDCKDRIEIKGFKTKLLEREREVASLMLRISDQNEKSEQILKYYEQKIKDLEKCNSDYSDEVTMLYMKLDSAVQINHIKQLEVDLRSLQVQLEKAKKHSSDASLEVKRLQGLLESSQSDLNSANSSFENMQLELEQEISILKTQLEAAKRERAEAVEEAKNAQELYEMTMRNLDAASEYSENIQMEYNKELDTLRSEIAAAVESKRRVALELKKAREDHEKATADRDALMRALQGSLDKSNAEIVNMKLMMAEKEEALEKTRNNLSQEYTRKANEFDNDIKKREDLMALKETQVNDLNALLKKTTHKVSSLERKLLDSTNSTEELLNEGSIQFQQVEEELKTKQRQLEAAEKVIENMRNNHIAKIRYLQQEFNSREEIYNRECQAKNAELVDMRDTFRGREESLNEQIVSKDQEIETLKVQIKQEKEDDDDDVNNTNDNADNNDNGNNENNENNDNNGDGGNMGNGSMETGPQEENEPTDQKPCNCNEKKNLENQLNETRSKLYDVERNNDELEQSFKYLYDVQSTEVTKKDQEIVSLTDKITEYESIIVSSQIEVRETRNSVERTALKYESQINDLKARYKRQENDIKFLENTNLIKSHKEQIDAYEKKLRSVHLNNDRMMLENSEQVKQLEDQVEQLQSELTTAYNEHSNQIENVRAMHSVEMSALMQANDQKESVKISKLKESYEAKLKDNNSEIDSLKVKLQNLCENNESVKKVHIITQQDLANALNAAEAMLKESNNQYQQLVDNHADQIDNLTESHQSITQNYLENEDQANEYLKKNRELLAEINKLNIQIEMANKTYDDLSNQYLTDITKINDDHNEMMKSLENMRMEKEQECQKVSQMLEDEKTEIFKLKQELSKAMETVAKLKRNNTTDEQKKKDELFELELLELNSTITNIQNSNKQQKQVIQDLQKDLVTKNEMIDEIKKINTNMEKRLSGMLEEVSSNNDEEERVLNSNDEEEDNSEDDEFRIFEMDIELPSVPAEETSSQENVAGASEPEIPCASCKNTIDELKCMVFTVTQHNGKLIDNCNRLRNKNQSLQVKINDMRKILNKAKIHAETMRKSGDHDKHKNLKSNDSMNVSNSDAQILKAKLDAEYANAEKLNRKITELHNAQKLYRTHLKQQTTDARWEEVNVSKAFQEGVKERRQSLHDQRRNINACDKCVQRLQEIEKYRKESMKLSQLNLMLNEKFNSLEAKLSDAEDSDALELQAQFDCTEILLRNLNRFITKGADTCEQCTMLLNYLYKKILALSKIYDNNTYWYFKAETDSQTIDEVLKVVERFQPKFGNELANEGMIILESVKNRLQRVKTVLCNKRRYIQNFLEILNKDSNILQQILSFPSDKRCMYYDSNKNVALLLLQIKERLTTSLRYLDETNVEEKERSRFKINKMDEHINEIEQQLVRDMPCSVNVLTYNQLALKYVSLKALIRLKLDRHDDLQDIQDYLMTNDDRIYSVEELNQNIAEAARMTAAAGNFTFGRGGPYGSARPTSTIVRPAPSTIVREAPCTIVREDPSNQMQDTASACTFGDNSDTAGSNSNATAFIAPEPAVPAPTNPIFIAPFDITPSTDATPIRPQSNDPTKVNNKYYITDDEIFALTNFK